MSRSKKKLELSGQTLRGEKLAYGAAPLTRLLKSSFENCEISLSCPINGLEVEECLFRDCVIHATTTQANLDFDTSIFERCKFTGEFPGCDFGARSTPNGKTRGTIKDCDLREAILDIVGFSNCDLSTLKLPRWPHFTITNPTATCPLIPNPLNCPEIDIIREVGMDMTPLTKGISYYAPLLVTETRYDEKQLRDLLASVPGILL